MLDFYIEEKNFDQFSQNIGSFIVRTAEKVKELDLDVDKQLDDLSISYNPFDKYACIGQNAENEKKSSEMSSFENSTPLEYEVKGIKTQKKLEFLIDLRDECDVSTVLIATKDFKKFNKGSTMTISIFGLDSENNWN